MPHALLINPNTRLDLTAELLAQVQAQMQGPLGAGDDRAMPLLGATAPFGDDYIASERSYVVAAHATLDAWHAHILMHGRPAAVLVACFGDPGVWALREVAGVPVMGLAEAAMREADALGPFGIVTGGAAWGPMLERLARGLRLGGPDHLRAVQTVEATGGGLAADPLAGEAMLAEACECLRAADAHRVAGAAPLASIIVGGAALGRWAARLQDRCPGLPLIDSVGAGARWLRQTLAG